MKAERLLSIIMILMDKKLISASSLAAELEVSVRTIYRDAETLSMAGIPIYTTTGRNGGIGILDSYKVDKQLLNTNDMAALFMGLESVSQFLPDDTVTSVNTKLSGAVDHQRRNDLLRQLKQIKIDNTPWTETAGILKLFKLIQTAVQDQQLINFNYTDRLGKSTVRTVEPYRLLIKEGIWYLQGYCIQRNDFRTFKLNRMSNCKELNITFAAREFPPEKLDAFQFKDQSLTAVRLQVSKSAADRLRSDYGESCLVSDAGGQCLIEIFLPQNDWTVNYIISFGDACQCCSPPELRKAVRTKLIKMLEAYKEIE